jgi:predicted PurR-regulated permease PerM
MSLPTESGESDERRFTGKTIEAAIRIALVALLLFMCYRILSPFLTLIVWGVIIAVAMYPTYQKILKGVKGRKGIAASIVTILLLLILIVPVWLLAGTFIDGINMLTDRLKEGSITIPPPPASVETWPLIGKKLAALWASAAQNLEQTLAQFGPQLKDAGMWFLGIAGQMGLAVLLFVGSVIVAGIMLAYADGSGAFTLRFARRLAGDKGEGLVHAAGSTIRSVFRGILGIAFIQSVLAGLGFLVAGIPGAGLWTFLCFIFCVVQIGTPPVMFPAAIYLWFTADTMTAILFTAWTVFVGISDNLLRPILLGRGAEAPLLVVLLGAIGGFIAMGVVGLFVGAVILTLGYKLFMTWLDAGQPSEVDRQESVLEQN